MRGPWARTCHRLDLRAVLLLSFLAAAFFTDALSAWIGERAASPGMAPVALRALDLALRSVSR